MDPLLPATPDTLDEALKTQALGHLRELLDLHWREAWDSADEDGKFDLDLVIADHAASRDEALNSMSRRSRETAPQSRRQISDTRSPAKPGTL
ncbi:MAG: hypothetical protein B9S36_07545 [Verrucomicrobiia bacterium Tous-C2TDCM]|nr:MAG: hypothetical protein B9S36_07545 [Verrucomicrobiae bacterium Tous-C2TDCM]